MDLLVLYRASQFFLLCGELFPTYSPLLSCPRRLGANSLLLFLQGVPEQSDKLPNGCLLILPLAARFLRDDVKDAISIELGVEAFQERFSLFGRQRWRMGDVKEKLHARFQLIHVLAAGTAAS